MKSNELNKRLTDAFPNLKDAYEEEIVWQEGDDTGSHTVYGDVFTPYVVTCIEENKKVEIQQAFDFIEKLLELKDTYVDEVVAFSVLESISYLFTERNELYNSLGEKSKEILNDFLLG